MDLYDQATAREEQDRKLAIATRRPDGPSATGRCLFCGTRLRKSRRMPPRRWCNAECRDDWQRTQR